MLSAALLAALINEVAVPELTAWLRARHAAGQGITDADILQKLISDTDMGVKIGEEWLASHPG